MSSLKELQTITYLLGSLNLQERNSEVADLQGSWPTSRRRRQLCQCSQAYVLFSARLES